MIVAPGQAVQGRARPRCWRISRNPVSTRVIVDGITYTLDEEIRLEKNKKHTIDVVIDRIVLSADSESRCAIRWKPDQPGDGVVKLVD